MHVDICRTHLLRHERREQPYADARHHPRGGTVKQPGAQAGGDAPHSKDEENFGEQAYDAVVESGWAEQVALRRGLKNLVCGKIITIKWYHTTTQDIYKGRCPKASHLTLRESYIIAYHDRKPLTAAPPLPVRFRDPPASRPLDLHLTICACFGGCCVPRLRVIYGCVQELPAESRHRHR